MSSISPSVDAKLSEKILVSLQNAIRIWLIASFKLFFILCCEEKLRKENESFTSILALIQRITPFAVVRFENRIKKIEIINIVSTLIKLQTTCLRFLI